MIKNSRKAFSIAEVLVTMMVVSLIVIMSAPVITRKKVNSNAQYQGGSWTCTLDANGKAVASDGSISADGKSCIFRPSGGATEYTVYVIGGGGGGAAGSDGNFKVSSYGQMVTDEVPETADYDYLLVGGGGGGASYYSYKNTALVGCNGAAGAVSSGTVRLTKGSQIHLSAGSGGGGGYTAASSDSIKDFVQQTGEVVTTAQQGYKSVFSSTAGTFEAAGGSAGDYQKNSGCATRTISSSAQSTVADFTDFGLSTAALICRGGDGSKCGVKASVGNSGVAIVRGTMVTGGGGGNAGDVVYKTIKRLPSEVIVKVGLGGAGGTTDGQDGYQGQPSAFGAYAVATGGNGGKAAAVTTTETTVKGEDGRPSPLGGFYEGSTGAKNAENNMDNNNGVVAPAGDLYGAGGGGGGFKRLVGRPLPGMDTSDYGVGKGGRGASGIVRVEWN